MDKIRINLKELEKRIDAEKLAVEDAKNENPLSDSKSPNASESKIRLIVSELLLESVSKVNKSGSYLQRKLEETKIKNEKRLDDTKTAPERFKKEASIIVDKNINKLNRIKKILSKSKIELNEYKVKNSLENIEPHYPDSLMFYTAIILAGLILESSLNAAVFSEFLTGGRIEGFGWALGYAFINLTVSWFFGYFAFRQLWSLSVAWKVVGVISTIIWLLFLLVWNLTVATVRASFESFLDKESEAIDIFNNLDISDPGSILLFSIGVTFGVIVFVEGFRNDDKHPGYGRKYRNVEKYSDKVEELTTRMNEKLKKILDSYLYILKKDERAIQSGIKSNLKYHQTRTKLINEFKNDLEQAKLSVEYFIKKYREKNTAERKNDPPKYFSKVITPFNINYEKFKDIVLEDYLSGEKEIFNQIKLNITEEYNKMSHSVNKTSNGK
jgi:hypothetical protein